ncbi:hypothetical protein QLL95_gp1080 [Cotonvirus japonicus]|uniref:Uncharacterized protein n=1 Tax=Cotonvirus japonicus TaxID=2811091 RepID=A0ABM7NSA9_9VIRU|nr:hypothetical protein QLL95_gp1080 [Cotonvirus japonicus]BCS83043.1 hypothetical protein [Cotonvirus japonicus]
MSEKNMYRLINPYIEGSLDTIIRASNSYSAGKKLYNSLSTYFTNHVNNFYMTIQNLQTKELTHFKIIEKRDKDGAVNFELLKIEDNFDPSLEKDLVNSVNKLSKQSGGKKKLSDSDTDSSESECFQFPIQPINRFVYYFLPYYQLNIIGLSPLDISRIFMPTFGLSPNPSIEIRLELYKYI